MLEATSCRVSELSEELTKCNEKLHMAGSLGMNLLEEKRKLQEEMTDLKSRYSKLLEDSEKERYDLQQKLWEAKSERDSRIAELEYEINELQQLLSESEHMAGVASKDHHDKKQQLEETIRQLTYSVEKMTEEKERMYSQLSKLTQRLCEEEKNKEKLLVQQILQDKMDELQRDNLQQKQEISELRCGSDTLALELKSSQDGILQLEQQLQQKEELLINAHQELTDVQEAMKQLQIELNTQLSESLTSNSVSLYEELNIRKEPLEAQDCGMANDIMENQLTPYTCSNCVALMEKLKHSEMETDKLNKQILELIKQKLDLAQQLEMWEGDVECLVGDQVIKQLNNDNKPTTRKEVGGIIRYLSKGIKKVAGANP